MLTLSEYRSIDPDWDKETILECCKKKNTDQPCSECCYDTWQEELNKVNPSYNAIVELTSQLQSKFDFITGRRNKYKAWIEELDKAESLAREICSQLKLIAIQSDKIWYNTCQAEKAIEILFCMLRDIYMQIDELRELYDNLQNCITRNNDPGLNKGQGILKYLQEYKAKLDATVKTRDDIIKNIVLAIQLANLLRNGISTRECDAEPQYKPCENEPVPCAGPDGSTYYGLKAIVCEWYKEFACETPCSGTGEPETGSDYNQQQQQGGSPQPETIPECELVPIFDFPICNNSFKNEVQDWLDKDNAALVDLLDKLNKAKAKQQSLLACKVSLDQAIKAVDPATRCK